MISLKFRSDREENMTRIIETPSQPVSAVNSGAMPTLPPDATPAPTGFYAPSANLLQPSELIGIGAIRHRDPVVIVGSGNSAQALSCYLSSLGCPVHLLVRSLDRVKTIAEQGRLTASGKLVGEFSLESVTTEPTKAFAAAKTIFIATVTTAYAEIAHNLAPHLRSGQEIILFSSKFAGVVQFSNILQQGNVRGVTVLETDALFACRIQDDGSVWIRGFKEWTLFSAVSRSKTDKCSGIMTRYFPGLQQADNVVQRGLTDFGALAHPLTMLANMNKVDNADPFLFYHEGFTERTIVLMERMEQEFRSIAEAYGTTIIPMPELLNRYYGCDNSSLLNAMRSVPNYRFSQAPTKLKHRYIEEDVSCSLVPLQQLARKALIETPIIDSIVSWASTILDIDFRQTGRNLDQLGWSNLSHQEILQAINE